ncbi:hypothetical protein PHJA_000408800 [Phtheirospermum japonicum]|uniref:Uncharacterized protein n=1 Tax=Phtheirospermum japonicum TaxID=374723 RepID=A0A830B6G6_9LAMI|nr:hypothetical protein PHJA_000408800 [Phtheirospermum japonicum]
MSKDLPPSSRTTRLSISTTPRAPFGPPCFLGRRPSPPPPLDSTFPGGCRMEKQMKLGVWKIPSKWLRGLKRNLLILCLRISADVVR